MKKNILIIDNSALVRRVICDIINADSNFQAIDVCRDGKEAFDQIQKKKYDALIVNALMPRMDGLQLLEKLQHKGIPFRAVLISSFSGKEKKSIIGSVKKGIVGFVAQPSTVIDAKSEKFEKALMEALNGVFASDNYFRMQENNLKVNHMEKPIKPMEKRSKIVAIASSTGGPQALQKVISNLPSNLDAPVVVVQHMPEGFTTILAERLDSECSIPVREAKKGEELQKGVVYIAPAGQHLEVVRGSNETHRFSFSDLPPIGKLKPCANVTYKSLAQTSYDLVICVVLTGMGADGTEGILSLKKDKDVYIIAQDKDSCVVYGMPRSIVEAGVVDQVNPISEIARTIIKNVGVR